MKVKTYDIINAGPNNRFMANGRIVSNSGRLVQPQNYPRPTFKQVSAAIDLILRGGNLQDVELVFPPVLEVIATCLRGCFIPRDEDHVFFTPDLAQIEARVVAYLAGQDDILEVFASGQDVYTYAANKLGFTGPNKRQEGKCVTLGLGFGLGKHKFIDLGETYGLTYSLQQSEKIVGDWRAENSHICNFWWDSDRTVKECIRAAKNSPLGKAEAEINKYVSVRVNKARNGSLLMTLRLPSGRRLYYRDVNIEIEQPEREIADAHRMYQNEEIDAAELADLLAEISQRRVRESITYFGIHQKTKRWEKLRTYGGKLVENITQAVARDVICDMALAIDDEGLGDLVLSVHDELIIEIPRAKAERNKARIEEIMSVSPAWLPGCPVKADGEIKERYGK
jgi:DNA polymerase